MTGVLTGLNELGDQYSRNERFAKCRIQGLDEPLLHGAQINPQHAVCPHDRPFVKCAERRVTKYRKFGLDTFDFAVIRNFDFDVDIQIIVELLAPRHWSRQPVKPDITGRLLELDPLYGQRLEIFKNQRNRERAPGKEYQEREREDDKFLCTQLLSPVPGGSNRTPAGKLDADEVNSDLNRLYAGPVFLDHQKCV